MPVYGPTKRRPFGLLPGGASMILVETVASLDTYTLVDHQQNEVAVGFEIDANHFVARARRWSLRPRRYSTRDANHGYGTYDSPTRRATSYASPPAAR